MASLISYPNPRDGYHDVVKLVRDRGRVVAPRGLTTRELTDVTIEFDSPLEALPTDCGRNLSEQIAAMEAWQLVGAFSDVDWVLRHAPQFERFTDVERSHGDNTGSDDRFFHGAYGFRIDSQMEHVVRKLKADPESRQAVINLWDQYYDNRPKMHDYPCTVALGFALRQDELHMRVVMRSNDVWLGLPYDVFQFSQLQQTVANCLDVALGSYVHHVWSLHLYASDADQVDQLHRPTTLGRKQPNGFGVPGEDAVAVMSRASGLHYYPNTVKPLTPSEEWYAAHN